MKHANILVYAINGKARNNIGRWNIKNIAVKQNVYGFDFYKQKDIAMAKDAYETYAHLTENLLSSSGA